MTLRIDPTNGQWREPRDWKRTVHEIDIKIQQVMDKNLGTCKKTVAKLKNEIGEVEEEITKKSARMKSIGRDIEKDQNQDRIPGKGNERSQGSS